MFDNIGSNPLGRLLSLIASLPEIRENKVTNLRTQINTGEYDVTQNLDEALDKILEEFLAET